MEIMQYVLCREIEPSKENINFTHREKRDIYRRQEGYMGNNPITQY